MPYKNKDSRMTVNGLTCSLNAPPALDIRKNSRGEETQHGLPPHNERPAYKVDEYPACPSSWMHGSNKAGSYFVAIEEGQGMWLDFNPCAKSKYHVAVVISVQGVNPITGQKSDKLRLEQYKECCPVHENEKFKQDRFCEKCGFAWPAQNYLATTGTPVRYFWLDGFRNADGTVRQYIFTAEEMKGVASQIIGKDRVFAIGIAFYLSKKEKPVKEESPARGSWIYATPQAMGFSDPPPVDDLYIDCAIGNTKWEGNDVYKGISDNSVKPSVTNDNLYSEDDIQVLSGEEAKRKRPEMYDSKGVMRSSKKAKGPSGSKMSANIDADVEVFSTKPVALNSLKVQGMAADQEVRTSSGIYEPDVVDGSKESVTYALGPLGPKKESRKQVAPVSEVSVKALEVGHGAAIKQEVHPDPEDMDFWRDEPEAFIYVNYCSPEECQKIIDSGKRDEKEDGFLQNLQAAK